MAVPSAMPSSELPIRAATETAIAHGITPDRCDILQDSSTLVLRLTETLVARVVTDVDGPRQGTGWFERENAVAQHLAENGAPVIPLHEEIPPGPHEHLGYPLNFWKFVTITGEPASPAEAGGRMFRCHEVLRSYAGPPLPELAIITESIALLETLRERDLMPEATLGMLRDRMSSSLEALRAFPKQPLHGDAHLGNLLNTTLGPLWTDWEDTFLGPVEWDVASMIWNARLIEEDHATADAMVEGYRQAGGSISGEAMHHSLVARAAVVCAWYPILYPNPTPDRVEKLRFRLDWLDNAR
ncbi:MAG: aminoglycoside phosphotransferase family protein [Verrucomicrobiaceae bacterium]|nr:MAG: aminoglycoside phosphotransferase family protein [Verrucomicrobiaceae bacterium]